MMGVGDVDGAVRRGGGGAAAGARRRAYFGTYLKPLYLYILALKNRSMLQRVNTKIRITVIYLIYFYQCLQSLYFKGTLY